MTKKPKGMVNFSVKDEEKLYFRIRHHCTEQNHEVEFEKTTEVNGFPVMRCPECGEEVILGVFNQKQHEKGENR